MNTEGPSEETRRGRPMQASVWVGALFVVCLGGPLVLSPMCRESHRWAPHVAALAERPDLNAVQREMRALDGAMHDILSAIARNDLASIPETLRVLHPFREEAGTAVAKKLYHPPRSSHDLIGYIEADDAFHNDLVRMVTAARAGDARATARAFGIAIQACTACHTRFRFDPDAL